MPVFSPAERLALAGFLAGYSGLTRLAYELDLRQFASCLASPKARQMSDANARRSLIATP